MTVAYSQDLIIHVHIISDVFVIPVCHYPSAKKSFLGQFPPLLMRIHLGNSQLFQREPQQTIIRCLLKQSTVTVHNAFQDQVSITADDIGLSAAVH